MTDENNLIVFRPDADYPITKRKKPGGCQCSNIRLEWSGRAPNVWIDEHTRALECKTCGAMIDPFDYLWALATEGVNLRQDLIRMREEKAALKAQLAMLSDEIKDARTVTRKSNRTPVSEPLESLK